MSDSSCLAIAVHAAGYERHNRPVELELPSTGSSIPVRLTEVDPEGSTIKDHIAFQYQPDANGSRKLIFILKGVTPPDTTRYFRLHLDPTGQPPDFAPQVAVSEVDSYEEQPSFRIETENTTYYYHHFGAGFASLIDSDNNDWISYHPWGGSDGKYRGIPNAVHPEAYFHPGGTGCTSRVVYAGPLCVTLASESNDGEWACTWDIFPRHARLTMLKGSRPYWFLYEGTPGGALDETGGFCVRSTGQRTPLAESWEEALPYPEWVYFGSANTRHVLYLVHHEADDAIDSYWPMEGNMTVLGLGRQARGKPLDKFLTRFPAQFTIGLAENGDLAAVSTLIDSAFRPLEVQVSTIQTNTQAQKG
ncbi:MAG TPA: hypothetical protein VKY59_18245 [Spirillospora sp.]|nr:hypothetical protein [Spirillospora sp.]